MGAKYIATSIPFCEALEEIRINGCGIDDEGLESIFEELKNPNIAKNIKLFVISNNPITENCADHLLEIVKNNPQMKVEMTQINLGDVAKLDILRPYEHRVIMEKQS